MVEEYAKDSIAAEIIKVPVDEWLSEQYGVYSLYAIRDRAIVSIDGLKPVARRLLYSFYKDGLTPTAPYAKSARACANVTTYHPHGNTSIEETAAGMAQWFTTRVPLTDPHGSVGRNHGDTPAAARYLELRLTKEAIELVKEVNDGAVAMGKNFDGSLDEPYLLPSRWPVHIINGNQGIAVGYSTTMFAHNPTEVMNALIALLKNPELTLDELLEIMPGPDLPTGGELMGVDGVRQYYETGAGGFSVRGRYTIENLPRGRTRIIFHNIPFQVSTESLKTKIGSLQNQGKMKEISTVKELSDLKHPMKFVIETKAGTNYHNVLSALFNDTDLEKKFFTNSTVLVDNTPVKAPMLDMLKNFIEFRKQCVLRKIGNRIRRIDTRLHQLKALQAVLINIDQCIAIIRNSDSVDEARNALANEFGLDETQADYILAMPLRRLTKADSLAIMTETDELVKEKNEIIDISSSPEKLTVYMAKEFEETKKIIADDRRTIITGLTKDDVKIQAKAVAQAAKESSKNLPCFVTRFANGTLLKTSEPFTYEENARKYEHGPILETIKMFTQDSLIIVANNGLGYKTPLSYIAMDHAVSPTDAGAQLPEGTHMVALAKTSTLKNEVGLLLGSKLGEAKIVKPEFPNKDVFPVFNLSEGDELINGRWLSKSVADAYVVSITSGSNILIYPANSLRPIGANAGGVRSQKLRDDEKVIYLGLLSTLKDDNILIASQANGSIKLTQAKAIPPKGKGSQGVNLHKFRKGEDHLVNAFAGEKITASVLGLENAVMMPPVTARAATGVEFNMNVVFGEIAESQL